jgi:DNA helicase HerA-like ATPase
LLKLSKPKLVFFFDEAHLLFNGAPRALVDKVEQVARLIRSKGVGVYFITQNPADVPEAILGQLGNRVQHALRAFTGRDQQELRRAAMTYRSNPAFDTETAIREVGTGEAVTSMLQDKGVPGIVERTLIRPPSSKLGPITEAQRAALIRTSALFGKYETPLDRDSAYEALKRIAEEAAKEAEEAAAAEAQAAETEREFKAARRYQPATPAKRTTSRARQPETLGEALGNAVMKELKGTTGRRIVRGLMGGLFRGR